jgi:hypothetical protein
LRKTNQLIININSNKQKQLNSSIFFHIKSHSLHTFHVSFNQVYLLPTFHIYTMHSTFSLAALTAIFLSLTPAQALPTVSPRQDFANDVFYLANCDSVSQISYYGDMTQSWAGQTPDVSVQVSPVGSWVIWEGEEVTAQFDSAFNTFIDADAFGMDAYTAVGKAQYVINGCLPVGSGWTSFTCFRDTGRWLYADATYGECYSTYFCTNVSFAVEYCNDEWLT